jgi:chemotaxis protein CheD
MDKLFQYPSALFDSDKPYEITTILGSCVSVCLFDQVLQIGGANHYMLPYWNGKGLASPKYGNIAIIKLIQKLESFGSDRKNLIAKVFGGGEVIQNTGNQFNIGERNIVVANEILKEQKIMVISSSTGGKNGRKIIFNSQTGEVMHRLIKNSN